MKDIELDERQRKAVAYVAGGLSAAEAFRKAGFAPSYARKAAARMKQPHFAAALEHERETLRDLRPFTAEQAVVEIDRQIRGALTAKSPNHMAAASLLTLKCKIYGLIKEKIEVVSLDLKGAIDQALRRVTDITPQSRPLVAQASEAVEPYYGPGVRDNPFGD